MYTYQDLTQLTSEAERMEFILTAISQYKTTDLYKWAKEGDAYARMNNTTIAQYQKILYTVTGRAVPDNYTANHKCASGFYRIFTTQGTQYLLGNGATFENPDTKDRLGGAKFDKQLQKLGKTALVMGVAFGFFNYDHIEVFSPLEFAPLWNEETGALSAGVRFWQISPDKPLRATLYEPDGYTEYIKRKGEDMNVFTEKRRYIQVVQSTAADGVQIMDGQNYPSFPIVPLWGNLERQCFLKGIKSQIDAYDLIKSGFANDLDDASVIYWTIQNAGGMDDIDLVKFIEHMKTVRAAVVGDGDDGARAEAHTIEVPYQSRETYLSRLENDLYNDAMALNTKIIAAGNVTATQIKAAYEPLNEKTDEFEYCVIDFIDAVLALIGLEDTVTFKRSQISNMAEETNLILSAAQYLDEETVLRKLPFLNPDEVEEIMKRKSAEDIDRFMGAEEETEEVVEVV